MSIFANKILNYIDIFIVCLIFLGFYRGYSKGFIIELSSLLAIVLGVYGSLKFSDLTLNFITIYFSEKLETIDSNYLKIFSFAFTFIVIIISISFLAKLLTKIVKILFLGFINKIFGGILGGLKYMLIIVFCASFFESLNSEFSLVNEKHLKELVFYSHSLEIGNFLLKTIDFENNLFNLFN